MCARTRTGYLAIVILISALWLAVLQALTTLPVSAAHWAVDTGPPRAASVRAAGAVAPSTAESARSEAANVSEVRDPAQGDQELRPTATQRLLPADRAPNRSGGTLRSHVGPAAITSADLAASLAGAPRLEAHRVSHAAATRGGHLPYYPTAPPLQG